MIRLINQRDREGLLLLIPFFPATAVVRSGTAYDRSGGVDPLNVAYILAEDGRTGVRIIEFEMDIIENQIIHMPGKHAIGGQIR